MVTIEDMALDFFSPSLVLDSALVAILLVGGALAGLVRRAWLERDLDHSASIRRVEFNQPAYALTVSGTWARFDVRAAPLMLAIAFVGVSMFSVFGAPAAFAVLNDRTPSYSLLLAFLGGCLAFGTVPGVITRMSICVEPGRLDFELVRLLRPTSRWSIRPKVVTFTKQGRCLAMQLTYAVGHGVPGPVLFDAGLLDPSDELLKDFVDVGSTITSIGGVAAPGSV